MTCTWHNGKYGAILQSITNSNSRGNGFDFVKSSGCVSQHLNGPIELVGSTGLFLQRMRQRRTTLHKAHLNHSVETISRGSEGGGGKALQPKDKERTGNSISEGSGGGGYVRFGQVAKKMIECENLQSLKS